MKYMTKANIKRSGLGSISSPNAMMNADLEFKIIKIRYTSRKLQTLSVASIPAPIPCSCRVPIMAPVHTSTSRNLYQAPIKILKNKTHTNKHYTTRLSSAYASARALGKQEVEKLFRRLE